MRKSPILQSEKGLSLYVNENVLGTILQGVTAYAAHLPQPLPLDAQGNPTGFAIVQPPFVVFTASQPKQIAYDTEIYEMQVSAHLEVQIDETQSGQDLFSPYIEAFRDLLEGLDENGTPIIYNWFNSANPGNFTNFGISSFKFATERLSEPGDGRVLVYEVDYNVGITTNSS